MYYFQQKRSAITANTKSLEQEGPLSAMTLEVYQICVDAGLLATMQPSRVWFPLQSTVKSKRSRLVLTVMDEVHESRALTLRTPYFLAHVNAMILAALDGHFQMSNNQSKHVFLFLLQLLAGKEV